jgi:hypothetical protein
MGRVGSWRGSLTNEDWALSTAEGSGRRPVVGASRVPMQGAQLAQRIRMSQIRSSRHPNNTPMTSPSPAASAPLSPDLRRQLEELRRGLLRVHKALLEDARIRYEREQGRIEGSGALLRLVLNDPWFAWLHPLSGLVVQIDELLASDDATSADGEALLNQARTLLKPDENGEGFQRRYHRAIQDVPDVLIAHVAVWKHLL